MRATILAKFPTAIYIHVCAGFGVVALMTRDAVRLPCGLQLAMSSSEFPLDRLTGPVLVGDGALRIGPIEVRVGRTVSSTVANLPPPRDDLVRDAARIADVGRYAPDGIDDPAVARQLLGRGDGLTPSGDDVLAGYLVAAAAYRLPADNLRALVQAEAPQRTTTLSAALLRHAAAGEAIPQVGGLLDALRGARPLRAALADLLDVGHTSGAALAAGVLVAARSAGTTAAAA